MNQDLDLDPRLSRAREQLGQAGQLHLLEFYDSLPSDAERAKLLRHIERVDWASLPAVVAEALAGHADAKIDSNGGAFEFRPIPPSACGGRSYTPPDEVARLTDAGLEAVANGRVGLVLLAGGQATRLGVTYPKGFLL